MKERHPLDASEGEAVEITTADGRSGVLVRYGWQRRLVDDEAIDEPLYRVDWQ